MSLAHATFNASTAYVPALRVVLGIHSAGNTGASSCHIRFAILSPLQQLLQLLRCQCQRDLQHRALDDNHTSQRASEHELAQDEQHYEEYHHEATLDLDEPGTRAQNVSAATTSQRT